MVIAQDFRLMNENYVNTLLFCLSAHFNKVLELRFVRFFLHEISPDYVKRPDDESDDNASIFL